MKKRFTLFLLTMLTLVTGSALAQVEAPADFYGKPIIIENKAVTGKVITATTDGGTDVVKGLDKADGDKAQQWIVTKTANGVNIQNVKTGKFIGRVGVDNKDPKITRLVDANSNEKDEWSVQFNNDGTFCLVSTFEGWNNIKPEEKHLYYENKAGKVGNLAEYGGADAQSRDMWTFTVAPTDTTKTDPDTPETPDTPAVDPHADFYGKAIIITNNVLKNKVITATTDGGNDVVKALDQNANDQAQQWIVTKTANGVNIQNVKTKKFIGRVGVDNKDPKITRLVDANSNEKDEWSVQFNNDGTFCLVSTFAGWNNIKPEEKHLYYENKAGKEGNLTEYGGADAQGRDMWTFSAAPTDTTKTDPDTPETPDTTVVDPHADFYGKAIIITNNVLKNKVVTATTDGSTDIVKGLDKNANDQAQQWIVTKTANGVNIQNVKTKKFLGRVGVDNKTPGSTTLVDASSAEKDEWSVQFNNDGTFCLVTTFAGWNNIKPEEKHLYYDTKAGKEGNLTEYGGADAQGRDMWTFSAAPTDTTKTDPDTPETPDTTVVDPHADFYGKAIIITNNVLKNKVITATTDGGNDVVKALDKNANDQAQQWIVTKTANGVNIQNVKTKKFIGRVGVDNKTPNITRLVDANSNEKDEWSVQFNNDGTFCLVSTFEGWNGIKAEEKHLYYENKAGKEGNLTEYGGADAQGRDMWTFILASNDTTKTDPDTPETPDTTVVDPHADFYGKAIVIANNVDKNKVLTANAEGTQVYAKDKAGNDEAQQWIVTKTANGINIKNVKTGKFIGRVGSSETSTTALVDANNNQKDEWSVEFNNDGTFFLVTSFKGWGSIKDEERHMQLEDKNTNGILNEYGGADADGYDKWTFAPASSSTTPDEPSKVDTTKFFGNRIIIESSVAAGKVIGMNAEGTEVVAVDKNTTDEGQLWVAVKTANGINLYNVKAHKLLGQVGVGNNSTVLTTGADKDQWSVKFNADGSFYLVTSFQGYQGIDPSQMHLQLNPTTGKLYEYGSDNYDKWTFTVVGEAQAGDTHIATGISSIKAGSDGENAPVYNIKGQRLSKPQRGINIIGGKKVVIR